MPDTAVHLSFGEEVRKSLPGKIREVLEDVPYCFAQLGPDPWFMYKPWRGKRQGRGRCMHTTRTGAFLMALAEEARKSDCPETVFSYLAGFLCHYALDTTTHPYIIRETTAGSPKKGAHRAFEHSLDIQELKRQGVWGEKHPMTGHSFQALRLPEKLRDPLNRAFETVYGWTNCHRDLNRAHRRMRFVYRLMENPRGLGDRLARISGNELLNSLAYAQSYYNGTDVENLEGRAWGNGFDETLTSGESFPVLRERARVRAVGMIEACYRYIMEGSLSREELAEEIGNASYLSGLPVDDPRNLKVPSLLPPGAEEKKPGK